METLHCPRCGNVVISGNPAAQKKRRSLITDSYQLSLHCTRCGEISLDEMPIDIKSRIERQQLRLMLILSALVLLAIVLMFLKQQGVKLAH